MESIHQTIIFDCPAHAFYETFLDEEAVSGFSGSPAQIEAEEGGSYHAYNEELVGEFTRLVQDRLIVMLWRPVVPDWPEDHYAVASLELSQSSDGTTVEFNISDVPAEFAASVEDGWTDLYWDPLQKLFAW